MPFGLGPITAISMVLVWAISLSFLIWGGTKHRQIAVAFLISWVAVRLSTVYTDPIYFLVAYPICACICISSRFNIVRTIGILYGIRVVIPALVFPFFTDYWFWMWEANNVVFYLQLLLAFGTIEYGKLGRLVLTVIPYNGRRHTDLPFLENGKKPPE